MQNEHHFHYIIIGNGLAGLQLALAFANDSFFDAHKIALIDSSDKTTNDKTWSFWEEGDGKWDDIVEKSWTSAQFHSPKMSLSLPLESYTYKTIRSIDFYNFAKLRLSPKENIHFILDDIQNVNENEMLTVVGTNGHYTSHHVFDSRIPSDFFSTKKKHTIIHQHFKGWVIECDTPSFQPEVFTMMDYRFSHNNSTSFIYMLPFSETHALVEFTFFTPYTVEDSVYDAALKDYIENYLQLKHSRIKETEIGNIPMTDFPFWDYHTPQITKIGTGGGWVKGSTGYSFKHTEKQVSKIVMNIKDGKKPSHQVFKKKYKFYDAIFLNVLKHENEKGIWIFERFYSKNSIATMFRFLDEETSFFEDLKIMKSLFSMAFIKAFFKTLFRS